MEWGVGGEGGREQKRAADYQSDIWSEGQEWKWLGSEMAVYENGHLSIFINANQ